MTNFNEEEFKIKVNKEADSIELLEKTPGFILLDSKLSDRVQEIIDELCNLDKNANMGERAISLAGELRGIKENEKHRKEIKSRRETLSSE